jgi:hypothetical protein
MSHAQMTLVDNTIRVAKTKDSLPRLTIYSNEFANLDPTKFCFFDPPTYPCKAFHISCKSTPTIKNNEDYVGVIVYDLGTFDAKCRTC